MISHVILIAIIFEILKIRLIKYMPKHWKLPSSFQGYLDFGDINFSWKIKMKIFFNLLRTKIMKRWKFEFIYCTYIMKGGHEVWGLWIAIYLRCLLVQTLAKKSSYQFALHPILDLFFNLSIVNFSKTQNLST